MLRVLMFLSLAIACTACGRQDRDETAPDSDGTRTRTVHVAPSVAYEHACAECHETGRNGAPRTGDLDAWAGRSSLWEAVLFEHAEQGYFDMPAQGLDSQLSDDEVAAAAQYMLEITHPDQPRD